MVLPLKAVILSKPRKDGNFVIYFQYCFSPTNRILLNTEIAIPKTYWNKKRQFITKTLPAEFGNPVVLNERLSRMLKTIEGLIEYAKKNSLGDILSFIKQTFTPEFKLESLANDKSIIIPVRMKSINLFDQIDDYIKSKEKKVVSTAMFRGMKERLMQFQLKTKMPITFEALDYNFYTNFVDFLTYDYVLHRRKELVYGLKLSTIGSTIKNLRVFVNDRVRRKIIPPINMDDFRILDEEADAIYLTYEEISAIHTLDLASNPELDYDRKLFVLGCLTGMRFSDYSTLEFKDYRNGMLYKKTNKQDSWVVVPMRKEATEVFTSLFSQVPKAISNPVFNKNIKQIAELAGITQLVTFSYKKGNKDVIVTKPKAFWVTSHTCRRSFATNEYLAGTDVNLIMKITGHKTYKDFFKYIRITQEEAARRIQEIWLSRDNMSAFGVVHSA